MQKQSIVILFLVSIIASPMDKLVAMLHKTPFALSDGNNQNNRGIHKYLGNYIRARNKRQIPIIRLEDVLDSRTPKSMLNLCKFNDPHYGESWIPTTGTINRFIQHYWPKIFTHSTHVEYKLGGSSNHGVFKVSDTTSPQQIKFVFKVYKNNMTQTLAENIQAFSSGPLGRLLYDVHFNKHKYSKESHWLFDRLPNIPQTECFISYIDPERNHNLIEVIHGAKGKSLYHIFHTPTEDVNAPQMLKITFYLVGQSLGAIHRLCMNNNITPEPHLWRTILHGDFHLVNIFFDKNSKKVSIIDCESSKHCINNLQKIDYDIFAFIFIPLLHFKMIYKEDNAHFQALIACNVAFLKGYIAMFPANVQQNLMYYLKNILNNRFLAALNIVRAMPGTNGVQSQEAIDLLANDTFDATNNDSESPYRGTEEATWETFISLCSEIRANPRAVERLCTNLRYAQQLLCS